MGASLWDRRQDPIAVSHDLDRAAVVQTHAGPLDVAHHVPELTQAEPLSRRVRTKREPDKPEALKRRGVHSLDALVLGPVAVADPEPADRTCADPGHRLAC